MDKDLIQIDRNEIVKLKNEGGELVFRKSAEKSLIRLLELQKMINEAVDQAKAKIVEVATEMLPDFRGIEGEEIKISFRYFGEKYEYDWTKREALMPFLIKKEYYKVDSKKVDDYVDKVNELPDGIKEKERTKTPSIRFLEDDNDEA